jgi:hypothetical protein
MATHVVTSDQKDKISNRLKEISRQVFLQREYGHDPDLLIDHLQSATEGKFIGDSKMVFPIQPSVTLSVPPFQFPRLFKAADTNLDEIIPVTECFAKKVLGVTVNLRKQFDFPAELPWKNMLLVFDPGLNNREAIEKSLKGQKLKVYEESNVMEYSGSAALGQPTLQIIENSIRPTEDTLGNLAKSPDQLNIDSRPYLELRGYALAFGLRYSTSKDYLDPETWTWFPKNRLPDGRVACGSWDPDVFYREVRFDWCGSGCVGSGDGARLAMSVPLKLQS